MYISGNDGWIEVICGSMFAGKTEELIRRIKRIDYAKKEIVVFKPMLDSRYSSTEVISHSKYRHEAIAINDPNDIFKYIKPTTYAVAIDEVQFFDVQLLNVCEKLANRGIRVLCAGLEQDFRGQTFGLMGDLLAKAEFVDKLQAICSQCGHSAARTQRLINGKPAKYDDEIVLIGASESYEPRCRHCHKILNDPIYE